MKLTYAKLRRVLSLFLQNKTMRDEFQKLISFKENEIDELGFLDLIEQSEIDLELLEILSDEKVSEISADDAIGVFVDFFCSTKSSWKKLEPLLSNLGLKVQAEITTT